MRHPLYKDGVLKGHFANEQRDRDGKLYTGDPIPDDHPDIVARDLALARKPKPDPLIEIRAQIEELKAMIISLKDKK